ncbi:MAG: ABC transporter ATP-binding protein [Faecalibacterium sp.]|jgi:putative ABC transport system ATP-binding protein|nr:ABC transporter ATP-binding protein [Faecalibacterium sp.]
MSVLSVSNVKKIYQATSAAPSAALDGVSFSVEKGEFVGIMGPSGAGKSTLLNVIATIDTVTSGKIEIGGQNICGIREPALSDFRRNKLGFVFQDYNLLDTLTLRENIALPLILAKKDAKQIERTVAEVARRLGIEALLGKYPCEVSGGQRQRASAARAIVNRPALLLADEPTGALDSKSAKDLMECLQNLNETQNATILLVTHDAFAASFCQRILLIKDGKLWRELHKEGTRKEFYDCIIAAFAELGGDSSELR